MKNCILIKDGEKYSGQYVATKSFSNHKVVSYGPNAQVVRKDAQDKGHKNPVVFYIPPKGMVHIY